MPNETPQQESVWDYPRPPRLEPTSKRIKVVFNGIVVAETEHALRLLETSHPPSYYIPPEDIRMEYFSATTQRTFCEFKGSASYWTLKIGEVISENVAWSYANPSRGYEALKDYLAFYPSRVEACYVNDEKVTPQAGDFYGGWITSDIIGPFKGGPGTQGW
ncbi:MAG: DUF427 domain-containing protein [Chloroflexi bacterium]|nr:DUF427 domain-containing protein [Chloroflexota bacterium]